MKIAILNVQAPFVRGGAEYLADSLAERVRGRGHQVEIVRIPFKWYPPAAIPEHMLACRMLRLEACEPDAVIALKFPAYLAPFPNKRLWLLHQFRQAYELWGTEHQGMPDTPENQRIREMIVAADNRYLPDARRIYTNSRIVAGRLKRYNGFDVDDVLYPPLDRPELFQPGEMGDYFFYPSRLNEVKRQHLVIEALRHTRSRFRLVLAGKPDNEAYGKHLQELIERWGLHDRVQMLGWITEEEKARLMNNAYAALYTPYDEDSYGYVTLEAFHAGKPVITLTDSGGTDELVEDERNGLIVPPTAEELGAAMERLWNDRPRCRDLGQGTHERLRELRIDWDYTLDRLLEAA